MNGSVCVGLGTAAESVGADSTVAVEIKIMEQRRYWRHCVEMSETEPIGCCSGALLLSADHLHSPAAYPHQHSSIGFLTSIVSPATSRSANSRLSLLSAA